MPKPNTRSLPLIAAIAGAKGGVGKSMITSNLAVHFAKGGLKVIVLDLDLGAANQHTLFGISRAHQGWTKWLFDQKGHLKEYLVQTKEENLFLIPASGFMPGIAQLSDKQKRTLIDEIKTLDVDIILLDLGAGSHKDTLDFFTLSDMKLLVTTPEKTALMNNFEFIKNVIYEAICRLFKNQPQILEKIDEFQLKPSLSIPKLIAKIEKEDYWLAQNLKEACQLLDIFVIFNQVKKIEEAMLAVRLKKIAQNQLGVDLKYPGILFYSEDIAASMEKMQPISSISFNSTPSRIFLRMTKNLIKQMRDENENKPKGKITLAWSQIKKDFYKNRVEQKKAGHLY